MPRQIFVVRHGQASARSQDYDVLSPLGTAQAARLGERFARGGVRFDAVFCGPRRRHRDTARHLVDAARAAGADALILGEALFSGAIDFSEASRGVAING